MKHEAFSHRYKFSYARVIFLQLIFMMAQPVSYGKTCKLVQYKRIGSGDIGLTHNSRVEYHKHMIAFRIGEALSIIDSSRIYAENCKKWYPKRSQQFDRWYRKWVSNNNKDIEYIRCASIKVLGDRSASNETRRMRNASMQMAKRKIIGYNKKKKSALCNSYSSYIQEKRNNLAHVVGRLKGKTTLSIGEPIKNTPPKIVIKIVANKKVWEVTYLKGATKGRKFTSKPRLFYVNGKVVAKYNNSMVLPKNTKILLLVTSKEGIHSLWIPGLGVKRDALKGIMNRIAFVANKTGIYPGTCAEMGGFKSPYMRIQVKVVGKAEYLKSALIRK